MKHIKAQITQKSADEFTAIASTELVDRHGEVVKADGWDIKNFKDNPILLAYHDHTKPVGKATKVWVDKTSKKPMLMFKGFISSATEESRGVKQLFQEGILNAFSVGFMPLEMEGNTITKQELHEISFVAVAANYQARRLAVKSLKEADISDETIEKLVGPEDRTDQLETELADMKKELASVKDKADIAVKGLQHLKPHRSKQVTTERLSMVKVIARSADILLKDNLPKGKSVAMHKIIKRSSEKLIRSHKGDL